ncbi:COP9 signalosome complex subunit 3 [Monoraphidium neglectum]|uniref:COP9 signalosome complex subunit 3 n=1 Tax=Monoraphidium neglectum TaxID=145388 RepID=A0A0D2M3J5_9CHLO|nr:COP9 signalosome complex subunit 3 [Monoraphidium neglectum]KIY95926.1 COP9 signalosome complex subunit 3 [Monoraphidium neglectum]|eukprot:XP_013894946.1 COP9 signalosome complex subunit 3 [Monoraphidium neglectum]
MEALKNQIIGLSSQDTLQQLHNALKGSEALLDQNHGALTAVLVELDPVQHSLGYLYLLNAHAKHLDAPLGDQAFIEAAARFLRDCAAAQIQLAPAVVAELCRRFKDQCVAAGTPRLGILPLLSALQRVRPTAEHLTPMHADVLQLCLLSKAYNAASPLLEGDCFSVEPAKTGVAPTDVLLYCFYGGMVAAGRKQWARALELWLQAVTAPTYVGNAITRARRGRCEGSGCGEVGGVWGRLAADAGGAVACYKKYVLGSLIHTGSLRPLPRFVSTRARQAVDSEAKAYAELATAYGSFNRERLRKVAEHHLPAFQLGKGDSQRRG